MRVSAGAVQGEPCGLLGGSDDALLQALMRYHYISVQQACRLLYSAGSLTYTQTKLRQLWESGYCERLFLPRAIQHGSAPGVYSLSRQGFHYLANGLLEEGYRRTLGRHHWSYLFLKHTLMVNDVLITAELLERKVPSIVVARMLHELDLKRTPLRITTVKGENLSVVGDGFLDFHIAGRYQQCMEEQVGGIALFLALMPRDRWRKRTTVG